MDRKKIFDMTGGRCFYCGMPLDYNDFHVDHFIPKALGGKDKDNLVPSCPDCNLSKGDLTIDEFRAKISSYAYSFQGRMVIKYLIIRGVWNTDAIPCASVPIKFYFEEANIKPPCEEVTQNGR